MAGFAVIDLETTGFAYNRTDRTCEVHAVSANNVERRRVERLRRAR